MDEYIDREAISEKIRKYYYKNPPNSSYQEGFDRGLDRAQRAILDAPAADVAPVVRCKDCANSYEDAFGRVCAYGICVDCTVPDDFYCASSKPKEGTC